MSSYRIETGPHGALVFGDISLDDLEDFCRMWTRRGWNLSDLGIAAATGATLALTSIEKSDIWREEINAEAQRKSAGDRELAWATGADTGMSSLYILQELGSSEPARAIAQRQLRRTWNHHPSPLDPSDLGRCIRLLDLFPEWRPRLAELSDNAPEWAALIGAWDELEALYREELAEGTGFARRTYAKMKELRGEK